MSSSKTLLNSSSNSSLIYSKSTPKHFLRPEMKLNRNSSLESNKTLKSRPSISPLPNSSSFIKPKPSQHILKPSSSSNSLKSFNKSNEKVYPSCLKDYAFLDEITSKFTLKTIELMKKDFSSHEGLYCHLMAVLSEIDSIFDKNQQLQFSMSRAREVFHFYMSKPGYVLNTFKNLPKLTETIRVSKKVISQCAVVVKMFEKGKASGVTLDVVEALKLIVNIQSKVFKAKVFVPSNKNKVKTQETLVTEEKTQEVSIMDFSQTNESVFRSVSPFPENEENLDPKLEKPAEKKTSKAKILEQLFLRIKSMPGTEKVELKASENLNTIESEVKVSKCLQEIEPNVVKIEKSVIKVKQSRAASNSPAPSYMRSLQRQSSSGCNKNQLQKFIKLKISSTEKKKEWEELRMVIEN